MSSRYSGERERRRVQRSVRDAKHMWSSMKEKKIANQENPFVYLLFFTVLKTDGNVEKNVSKMSLNAKYPLMT